MSYRVKKVALGSGLTTMAMSNIRLASEALKLRAADRPSMTVFRVMFLPSWGRKPWFARVFIMGQGPRTKTYQRLFEQSLDASHRTVVCPSGLPLSKVRVGRSQSQH